MVPGRKTCTNTERNSFADLLARLPIGGLFRVSLRMPAQVTLPMSTARHKEKALYKLLDMLAAGPLFTGRLFVLSTRLIKLRIRTNCSPRGELLNASRF